MVYSGSAAMRLSGQRMARVTRQAAPATPPATPGSQTRRRAARGERPAIQVVSTGAAMPTRGASSTPTPTASASSADSSTSSSTDEWSQCGASAWPWRHSGMMDHTSADTPGMPSSQSTMKMRHCRRGGAAGVLEASDMGAVRRKESELR
ncbi:hypothetical protein D3C86_1600830 [compost metagenome]